MLFYSIDDACVIKLYAVDKQNDADKALRHRHTEVGEHCRLKEVAHHARVCVYRYGVSYHKSTP
jgi:hypothetical protein